MGVPAALELRHEAHGAAKSCEAATAGWGAQEAFTGRTQQNPPWASIFPSVKWDNMGTELTGSEIDEVLISAAGTQQALNTC